MEGQRVTDGHRQIAGKPLGKQAAEPAGHQRMIEGEKLGERSGASAKVAAKLGG